MGKLIGGILGFIAFNFFGAILGVVIGHQFDTGLASIGNAPPKGQRSAVQQIFFDTLFQLLGHVAKADGHISEEEVATTEQLMTQLGLTDEQRKTSIALFKKGAGADFSVDEVMITFLNSCGRNTRLQMTLLEFLVHLAYADGVLHSAESDIIKRVAHWLGLRDARFEQLMSMFKAQYGFSGGNKQSPNKLADAYTALGITDAASDAEVKRAYRKLMSQHHPDKMIAQGVPEAMIKLANEKSAEIRAAYEQITDSRKA